MRSAPEHPLLNGEGTERRGARTMEEGLETLGAPNSTPARSVRHPLKSPASPASLPGSAEERKLRKQKERRAREKEKKEAERAPRSPAAPLGESRRHGAPRGLNEGGGNGAPG